MTHSQRPITIPDDSGVKTAIHCDCALPALGKGRENVIKKLERLKADAEKRGSIGPMCNAYDGEAIGYGTAIALLREESR